MSRRIALQVHRVTINNPTGVHRYVLSLARALVETASAGDTVELWAGREEGEARGGMGVDLRAWPGNRRLLHLAWALLQRPAADRFTGPVDLMHALTAAVPLPTRRPLVVTIHDVLPLQHPEWYAAGPRWGVARALRHAADHATRIITPSEAVREDVRAHLGVEPARVEVIPEGAHESFGRPVPDARLRATCEAYAVTPDRFIVTVGEIGPRKNLPTLFRALAALRAQGVEPPTLVVVGADGRDAERTRALPEQLGVERWVRFTGRVDDAELCRLVQAARALAHASTYEGFGLTPLEAMAAGTAVVVSSAGSLPEVVGDVGLLVRPSDIDGWAAALHRVTTDDEWALSAAAAGRRRAASFTWTSAAERTWAVYDRVLSG